MMYYSGHGEIGLLKFSDFDEKYEVIVQNILKYADDQTKKTAKTDKISWFVNWYIDACHSGSAKDSTVKWVDQ